MLCRIGSLFLNMLEFSGIGVVACSGCGCGDFCRVGGCVK